MKKQGHIVSYTAKELAALRARGKDKTDWKRVDAKSEAELAADMASDEAWDGVPHDWVSQAAAAIRTLRRPKENKRQVTMRFDPLVLEYFRNQGRGWQGLINAVLRSFVESQQSTGSRMAAEPPHRSRP
jgi:uncharacterized protein (DUF4415 family)